MLAISLSLEGADMKHLVIALGAFLASLGTAQAQGPVTVGDIVISTGGVSTLLFNGATPKHGFLVAVATVGEPFCNISDDGPAVAYQGFFVGSLTPNSTSFAFFAVPMFVTPPGYTPVGPVSVNCNSTAVLTARMW
jgi:hypothetical protein